MKQICYLKGFTLIEIIAVLLLTSVVGGMFYSYFNSAFVESNKPLENIQKSYELHKVMENMIADYTLNYPEWQKRQARWQKLTYYVADTLIRADGDKGYIYKCFTAGKSGNIEPPYKEPSGFASGFSPITDGTLTWVRQKDLNELKNKIALPIPNEYGTYTVQEKFIKFTSVSADTYQEEDILPGEPETILKVTITNDSGTSLTNLFTNVN